MNTPVQRSWINNTKTNETAIMCEIIFNLCNTCMTIISSKIKFCNAGSGKDMTVCLDEFKIVKMSGGLNAFVTKEGLEHIGATVTHDMRMNLVEFMTVTKVWNVCKDCC